MLHQDNLRDLLSQEISDREKALLCLAAEPVHPRGIKEVTDIAIAAGWRQAKKKNLSLIYKRASGLVARTAEGWELTSDGSQFAAEKAGPILQCPIPATTSSLRAHLEKIEDLNTRSFIEEAIACFESKHFRAAVVLSWIGAVSLLHRHVVDHKLAEFNAEALRRNPKWKAAKTTDDLGLLKEDTFLDILQAISVIGKNVKQELKQALTLRNGCGHPNSLKLAEHKVSAHIEDLMLNVFAVF